MKTLCHLPRAILAAATLSLLGGCGGGGGGAGDSAPPSPTIDQAQGLWESATGGAAQSSAVVLPNGEAWIAINDNGGARTRLLKVALAVSAQAFAGTGASYTLATSSAAQTKDSTSVSAAIAAKSSFSGTATTGAVTDTLAMSYQSRYDTAASVADYAASWSGSAGAGTVTYTLTINAGGSISGSSSTGCTYSGSVGARAEAKAVASLSLVQSCAGSAPLSFSGIALLNAAKTGATLAGTTSDGASALLLALAKG